MISLCNCRPLIAKGKGGVSTISKTAGAEFIIDKRSVLLNVIRILLTGARIGCASDIAFASGADP
jgi:hypothetical protein